MGAQGDERIAIIGMAGRFPGADSVEALWRILDEGRDAVTDYSDAECLAAGVAPELVAHPDYVKSGAHLRGAGMFDATFFGYTGREAELMDPQQRIFLEVCHEALEESGHGPTTFSGPVGVYGGPRSSDYTRLLTGPEYCDVAADFAKAANAPDGLTTKVAYKLDLTGPALTIQTACSTSLVAVHLACQQLLDGECDMALAGGVSLRLPQHAGYLYREGGTLSRSGRCRSFDAAADGLIFGDGAAVVVLRRLSDALADGDRILAVIRGSAVNNDGARRAGYAAPGLMGQARAIREAILVAGLESTDVTYVEAHGAGTPLGDRVEFNALMRAFDTDERGFCALGSVKANVGHLDCAAGVTGLIKTVLAIRYGRIPGNPQLRSPNPELNLIESPFYLAAERTDWHPPSGKRIAGVSSLGIGGTNVHVVVAEPPVPPPPLRSPAGRHLVVLSARSPEALEQASDDLRRYLEEHADADPADVAFTLQTGRQAHRHRRAVLADGCAGAARALRDGDFVTDSTTLPRHLADLVDGWLSGREVSWQPLHAGRSRRRLALPTHPMFRRHYWPVTPAEQAESPAPAGLPEEETKTMDAFLVELTTLVAARFKVDPALLDPDVPFLEIGADSLALLNVLAPIEDRYGVRLSIRQFFGEVRTLSELADHLKKTSTRREPLAAGEPVVPQSAAVTGAQPAPSAVERLLAEQLRLMHHQLELIGGTAAAGPDRSGAAGVPDVQAVAVPVPASPVTTREPAPVAPLAPGRRRKDGRSAVDPTRRDEYLRRLAVRYTARTARSKAYAERFREVIADSRSTIGFRMSTKEMLYPIVAGRGRGARLWDVDGNEYIDLTLGFGVHLFGHNPSLVTQAIAERMETGFSLGPRSELVNDVAEDVLALTGMDRVAFLNSGSEAVITALKLARAATGREKIVIFETGYHGHSEGVLAAPNWVGGELRAKPLAIGVTQGAIDNVYVLDFGTEQALEFIDRHGSELAAVLTEPVTTRHPGVQQPDFLRRLRELTWKHGAKLIFDEMVTGFRCHPGGVQGLYGIEADLATYGKIIGGGMPLGVVAGRGGTMDAIDGGGWRFGDGSYPTAESTFFGGTFNQHPLTMAVAKATLGELRRQGPDLQRSLDDRTRRFVDAMNTDFQELDAPIEVTRFSSCYRFMHDANMDLFYYNMLDRGIFIWEWRNCFLSTAHDDKDLDLIRDAARESIEELRENGLIPPRSGQDAPAAGRPVPSGGNGAPLPSSRRLTAASRAQQQLWALANVSAEGSLAYTLFAGFWLDGRLDRDAFRAAARGAVERHHALRTVFTADGASTCVVTMEELAWDEMFSEAECAESEVTAFLDAQARRPLDVPGGPLLRMCLVRVGVDKHLLHIAVHHTIADGWSLLPWMEDLAALYNGELGLLPADGLPAPVQFAEFLARQAGEAGSARSREDRVHWNALLDGAPEPELPSGRGAGLPSFRTERHRFELDKARADRLRAAARANGVTLFAFLVAGWGVLQHRLTAQDDVVVFAPSAARPDGFERTVGYCANQMALRLSTKAGTDVSGYLRSVQDRLLDALEHAGLPFAEVVADLDARQPGLARRLFRSSIVLDRRVRCPDLAGLRMSEVENMPLHCSPYALSLQVVDTADGGLRCELDVDVEALPPGLAERLAGYLTRLLDRMAEDGGGGLPALDVLDDAERGEVLDFGRGPTVDLGSRRIPELFDVIAAEAPGRIAVTCEGRSLTYEELGSASNRLARVLRRVLPPDGDGGAFVGLRLPRSERFLVALLAVWKAGAAYVPLEPRHPIERHARMLELAGVEVVLCDEPAEQVPGVRWLRLADLLAEAGGEVEDLGAADAFAGLDTAAYVMFTSGSTGEPKGIVVEHRAMLNHVRAMVGAFAIREDSVVAQNAPGAFDVSVWQWTAALTVGGSVAVCPDADVAEPRRMLRRLAQDRVTVLGLVPSYLTVLLDELDLQDPAPGTVLAGLRHVVLNAEPLKPVLVERWYARFPEVPLSNAYGATETADDVMIPVTGVPDGLVTPTGGPIANTSVYVVDDAFRPVPVGVKGEIVVAGVAVGRGYLHGVGGSARAFLGVNPVEPGRGGRVYRTGDLGRWRPDGQLEVLGRRDHQVKVRGQRVEFGEIERVLHRVPGVTNAIVKAFEAVATGDTYLVGYLVPSPGAVLDVAAIQAALRAKLPDYMVPARMVVLDSLVLNATGKVDRMALAEPEPEDDRPVTGARHSLDERVLSAVASLFGVDRVGIDDDFFALGGNSIAAVRLSQRLRAAIGAEVPVMTVFDHPILRDLADALAAGGGQDLAERPEPDADRARTLEWGRGPEVDLGSTTVAELFAARAAMDPGRVAVICDGRELTYGELDARANRLARGLRRALPSHPGIETFVGVRLPRSERFLVALLAVWKAGAAYVPLEPRHPIERHARMLELAGVEVVLCDEPTDRLPDYRWLRFADLSAEADDGGEGQDAAGTFAGLDTAAYVMFTSGSTGEPKGIVIEHRSMLNHVLAKTDSYEVGPSTLLVQNAPVSVDVAIWQFFAPLLAGGRVLVPSDAEITDPKAFLTVLDDRTATLIELVPSFLAVLLDELDLQDPAPGTVLAGLRHVVLNAEPLKPVLVERWYARFPEVPLSNAYGATETADDVMHPRTRVPDGLVTPTGGPIANTSVYVVDDAFRPVPVGVKGEIVVAGVAVGRGYLHGVGGSARAFLGVNPVEPGRGGRVYRTGDLGRWRPDGQLEVLGRRDHQVKVRGQRVEFGEIERVLHRVPGVADAVVKGFPQPGGDHDLVAYLLPSPRAALDVEEIRAALRAKLPDFMIPARFVISETFALTTTGKVDRMALAEPEPEDDRPVTGARHSLDERVLSAVASLFGVDRVGIDDDFFALGGNSIAAVRLSQRLRAAIGAEVPVMTVFDHPILRDLADALTAEAGTLDGTIMPVGERPFYRASASEERMFFLWAMEPQGCLYNLPMALVVDDLLDRDRLTRAVNAVAAKHDILRTVFDVREGALVQRVSPEVTLTVADLGESEEGLEELVARWVEPHDLRTGPPIRLGLAVRPGGRASVLLLDTPHIVLDEGSIPVLFRDLAAAYRGEALDEAALTYKDFAEWEHLYRTTDAYQEDRRYWLDRLASPPAPLDFPMGARPPVLTTQGGRRSFFLTARLTEKLRRYCRENRFTPYMVLLSVYKLMLAKYAGRTDIVVGTPVDGRYHPSCADVVGMFGNSLPIRSAPIGAKAFTDFVAEVRSAVVEGLQRQSYPFEELVRELELPRDPSRNPLFDFMFVYTELENYRFDMGGSVGTAVPVTIGVAKLDLTLSAFERDSGIELVQEYSTGVFDRLAVECMGMHYTNLVEQVLDQPERTLDDFVLDPREQPATRRPDRSETASEAAGLGLHQVFETVADRMPDHLAVVSGPVRLTYRELDEHANRLAHRLRAAGAGVGTPVGLLVRNPRDTIIGMLGVLKAGGCYVPFDEATPVARALALLAGCGAVCVVSDRVTDGELPAGMGLLDPREEGADPSRPDAVGSDRDLAYIMFTSGSTGSPKGVMVEHASVRRLTHRPLYLPISGGERVLQATSWGFDVSAAALYTALLNGGTAVCPQRGELVDIHALRAIVEAEDVSLAFLSTGFFHLLVDRAPECLDPIETIVVAGERLSADHARRTVARLGPGRLVNAYGPTEGTIYATAHAVDDMDGVESVPIGRPVDETEVYILLPNDVPAPIGVAGELCIGGRAVARGYLHGTDGGPFQPDPFAEGGRLYRTGDLARRLPDGTVEYLGRRDGQVKIRGFRVELAEVEAELRRCDGVVDAAATVVSDAQGMAVLWAYLVGPDEERLPSITAALKSAVPDHMVPVRFFVLDRLPLNANGKVDRQALDERARSTLAGGRISVQRTGTEEALIGIYRDRLGLGDVGPDDDFFEVGGHSLKVVVLIAEIRETFGVEVRLMDFLPTPRIRVLAEHVDNLRWLTRADTPQDGPGEDLEEFVL